MIYSPDIIHSLQERLQYPLPGLEAQMEMAPSVRRKELTIPENARLSGVLILLYPHLNGELHLVLMKRAEDGHAHSGQISFPGGRWEQEDPDFTYTALREAEEEIGVGRETVNVLGKMSELYIPPSNFMVYPTLGYIEERPSFIPDPREVAGIIEVKVDTFWQQEVKGEFKVMASGGFNYKAPGYLIDGHVVWGATAMMLAELATVLKEI